MVMFHQIYDLGINKKVITILKNGPTKARQVLHIHSRQNDYETLKFFKFEQNKGQRQNYFWGRN